MIDLACYDGGLKFSKLRYPYELDKLKIGSFNYFNKHLGMSNYMDNFNSWLKRQSVTLIVGIDDVTIVGWVMTERWNQNSKDGRSVHVLRGIEVSPSISRRGIGKVLFLLSFKACPGHILTKPVNAIAKAFFLSLGFQEPAKDCPVDLSNYPGYLFLPEVHELKSVPAELKINNEGLLKIQRDLYVKDVFRPAFNLSSEQDPEVASVKEGTMVRDLVGPDPFEPVSRVEADVHCARPFSCSCVPIVQSASDTAAPTNREFLKEHKMMSQCSCGEYMTHKYAVSGSSSGFLFICAACGNERYFLKNK
ncbi:GNAT family N-acetyltransferase [Methanomethylovorans sp.]|uniref:GNAT family N-acetyltransferase n=1 Tax=Methanomethylovorans sp. TaxID=2758717 RepID=UPI00345EDC98